MDLFEARKSKPVLIAGHRGNWGGSILPNTIGAYEAALQLGADIVESDILMSKDGVFFAYHTGEEKGSFGIDEKLMNLTSDEIRHLVFRNSMFETVSEKVNYMDDVLNYLKGRCFINVDRGWKCGWENVLRYLKSKNMDDQIILKCPPQKDLLDTLSAVAPDLQYMGIIRTIDDFEMIMEYSGINTVAMEINYASEDEPVASASFVENLHDKGLLAWTNALTLNDCHPLAAGCDDNTSIKKGPGYGWGKLIEKGYDIIQTDWPSLLKKYIETIKGEIK